MKKQGELTHKEAVRKALEMLGGKAQLKQIYPVAIKLIGKNTRSVDIKATIRRELNSSPFYFKATPDMEGWWELISYQEEIVRRDQRIWDLEEENKQLMALKTEDDFVKRLVCETKNLYKHEKEKIEVIRQILYKLGRSDAEAELDAWIEGREYKPSFSVSGDYVVSKHIEYEVNGVADGATGINVSKETK